MNLGFTAADDGELVEKNRRLLVEAVTGSIETPLVTLRQIHSNVLVVGAAEDAGRQSPHKADGLVTDQPGLLLGVQTADCIPVLVVDKKLRVVAAFHAGVAGNCAADCRTGRGAHAA